LARDGEKESGVNLFLFQRWAATNDMFTLDFGDKREKYYNA
jgi:hypothetical protein